MASKDTSGYKGWWPVRFFTGKGPDGQMQGQDGFRNVVNGQEVKPENGWNARELPYPTGDNANCRHVSAAYRHNYDQIDWGKS